MRAAFGVLDHQALADLMGVPIEDEQCAELPLVGLAIRDKLRECIAQQRVRRNRILVRQ